MLVGVLNLHRDPKSLVRTGERWKIPYSHRILRIEGSTEYSRCTCVDIDLHALIMNHFEHRVLRIEPINTAVRGVLVRALNLHRDRKSLARTGERWKIS